MKFSQIPVILSILGALISCSNADDGCDYSAVTIDRFDLTAARYAAMPPSEMDSVLAYYAPVLTFFRRTVGIDDADSVVMSQYALSPAMSVFGPDVVNRLPDLSREEQAIGGVFGRMALELPDIEVPKRVYGIVSPYNQSVVVMDSVVMIALNHYLGADYPGYAGYVDDYLKPLKESDRIPMDVAESLVRIHCPYKGGDGATALSRILYEGAVVEALMRVVPGATLAGVLGYDAGAMQWAEANERKAWSELVSRELLYSIDPMVADRLVTPAPSTSILTPDAPGRLGRFIGYRIVRDYLSQHPETSLGKLLSEDFYGAARTLVDAKYKP